MDSNVQSLTYLGLNPVLFYLLKCHVSKFQKYITKKEWPGSTMSRGPILGVNMPSWGSSRSVNVREWPLKYLN